MALQIRRGTDAERTAGGGVVFAEGELIYVTDTDALYIGDGSTAGGVKLTDNAGAVLGSYITADTINSKLVLQQNLDLNGKDIIGNGNININGTITATGNVNIGDDANTDTVDFTAKITSSLTPNADSTYNIGAMNARWNNGWFTGLVVDGQIDAVAVNADVVADNSTVMVDVSANEFNGNLTGNVTGDLTGDTAGTHTGAVIGNVTGNTNGYHTGDVKGSVFGDDSTPIVDAVNNTLAGNLTGNVTGNVTGNTTGDHTGDVKGTGGGTIIISNNGPADAELFVDNITATGVINGNVIGNVTGNAAGDHTGTFNGTITATGTLDGDVTGSVFSDGSVLLVDAVAGTIPASVIDGTLTNNLTGNAAGDHSGTFTGNIFTSLIDSEDSSPITVTPAVTFESDIISTNSVQLSTTPGTPGSATVSLSSNGTINAQELQVLTIRHTSDGEITVADRIAFTERVNLEKILNSQSDISAQTIPGLPDATITVETFTGDPEDDAQVADPANYDVHFKAQPSKVTFGVPAKFAVVADDTARSTLVPSPEKGMVILMESGTTPAATNQLQFYNGTAWTNV